MTGGGKAECSLRVARVHFLGGGGGKISTLLKEEEKLRDFRGGGQRDY